MLKRLFFMIVSLCMTIGIAFADVDVNKADQAALEGVKGIGPKISKTIIDERNKNGKFKDWSDFETRVKGIGDKNSAKLSEAGLTINGQSKPGAAASKSAAKGTSSSTSSSSGGGSSASDKKDKSSSKSGAQGTSKGAATSQ